MNCVWTNDTTLWIPGLYIPTAWNGTGATDMMEEALRMAKQGEGNIRINNRTPLK